MRAEKPTLPEGTVWPEETREWFEAWRQSRCTDHWDERQWQYMFDTAIVHALVYGSSDFSALAQLHQREAFMGLSFED